MKIKRGAALLENIMIESYYYFVRRKHENDASAEDKSG
jgi:hypothetical protein